MKINICLASDDNYSKYLIVTMASILKSANIDDEFHFYILENNISNEDKNKIIILKKIKCFDISFIQINNNMLEKFISFKTLSYISNFTYVRFVVADILKDVDKILYLDCDIIVCKSLSDLYKENIEKYYCAGIEDIGYYFFVKHEIYYITDIYVNAGVLLLNLNLWRQNNITSKCIQFAQNKKFILCDQDVINKVCENKIKLVELKWNLQQVCFDIVNRFTFHPKIKEIRNVIKNYNIIHYTNSHKPWNSYTPLRKEYMQVENFVYGKINNNIGFKLKIFISFCIYNMTNIIYVLRYIVSPIFKIYRRNQFIKIKILNLVEFNVFKKKSKFFQK